MDTLKMYKHAIECFNKGDIEGMAKSWDDDISIMDMTDDSLVVKGKDHAIQMFKNQYKRQPTHITIDKVVQMGNKLISYEKEEDQDHHITEAMCVLEEDHGLIKHMYWFF